MIKDRVGAEHDFHDQAYAVGWGERNRPTPQRVALFEVMYEELEAGLPADACIVELGIGPGYLASHLLSRWPGIHYCGLDFSLPMLDSARKRLEGYGARVGYLQADLIKDTWWEKLPGPVAAIVSTWALHDLGAPRHTEAVYENCARVLKAGGVFLNGDFIKPDGAEQEYEAGRFEVSKHLEMLKRVGFDEAECLLVLEKELEAPTSGTNYACLKAVV